MTRAIVAAFAAAGLLLAAAPQAGAASPPSAWDGLVKVPSKKLDLVYLLPGADFRGYHKVMVDPTEVAFRKNWQRDYNNSTGSLAARISDSDAQKMLDRARTGFEKIFLKAYADAGYQAATAPGPDVLRLRTAVTNLTVTAPDKMTAGRTRSFAREAGEGTLVLEARDSVTGALLGRAIDRRLAGDMGPYLRTSVSNRGDFESLFKAWAKASVEGLNALKAASPVAAN